jgi:putative SOS response-associated peptidase YedK
MCGRYYRRSDKQRIAEAFKLGKLPEGFVLPDWDYNVAPSTFQPIIRADKETGDRELVLMRWGLVPFFTKQLSDVKGISTINARAETVEKSPSFRTPFKKRRCLVPADGFYEWKKLDPKTKQPFAFGMGDDAPFAFAGLWDAWKDQAGNWLQSFSIITTEANELMASYLALAEEDEKPVEP